MCNLQLFPAQVLVSSHFLVRPFVLSLLLYLTRFIFFHPSVKFVFLSCRGRTAAPVLRGQTSNFIFYFNSWSQCLPAVMLGFVVRRNQTADYRFHLSASVIGAVRVELSNKNFLFFLRYRDMEKVFNPLTDFLHFCFYHTLMSWNHQKYIFLLEADNMRKLY